MEYINILEKLTLCKKCNNYKITSTKHYQWSACFIYKCQICKTYWYVCKEHSKRFGETQVSRMNRHFKTKSHFVNSQNLVQDLTESRGLHNECSKHTSDEDDDYNSHCMDFDDDIQLVESSVSECDNDDYSESETQLTKFVHEESHLKGKGVSTLIGRAFQQSNHCSILPTLDETLYHIEICEFLSKITTDQQLQFLQILNKSQRMTFTRTRIPTTMDDIRKFYTYNKYSILQNIPRPVVEEIDNHAVVSIKSVIEHVLALGVNIPLIKSSNYNNIEVDNSSLLHTNKVQELLLNVDKTEHNEEIHPYVIFIVIWSDDFEVNNTRKNKSSTWLKTISIVNPDVGDCANNYTYPIALSSKSAEHKKANKYFNDELKLLQKAHWYYYHELGKKIPIVVRVLAMSADRPERNSLNDMLSHNGKSSRRWRYSSLCCPYKMASCEQCIKDRVYGMYTRGALDSSGNKRNCRKCCDFNYEVNYNKCNEFFPPKNYPNIAESLVNNKDLIITAPIGRNVCQSSGTNFKLKPIEVTFDILSQGLRFAIYNLLEKNWDRTETVSYLKLICVKEGTINKAINSALEGLKNKKCVTEIVKEIDIPPMWNSVLSLDQFIDTPMHHLFEGIVKACIEILISYMKLEKKWSKFAQLCNHYLEDIHSLRIGFCKCECLTNEDDFKTGGWLAETYLGFSRIMVIVLGHIDTYIEENAQGLQELKMIFQTLLAMLSRLMTDDYIDPENLEDYIKLFLSACHGYEKAIGFPKDQNNALMNPNWYKKGNFVSLLNLPNQIKLYGPVRLHWEGVKERYIHQIKPILTNIRPTTSYLKTKMEEMHRRQNFDVMTGTNEINKTVKKFQVKRNDDIKQYYSFFSVKEKMINYECIAGVMFKGDIHNIYILISESKNVALHPLQIKEENISYRLNVCYFHDIELRSSPSTIIPKYKLRDENIYDYLIMVPYHHGEIDRDNGFAFITKSWKILNQNMTFEYYKPSIKHIEKLYEVPHK